MNGNGLESNNDSNHPPAETASHADSYFESYEDLHVHRLMIDDIPRTEAYRKAILSSNIFKDKVVMDVGAGTGILSLFCAEAGAKKVFAVEASRMADVALANSKENNFENIIEVIHKKVEDLTEEIQVDIIVSEWMGFYLLHESMIDSVFHARDKHLKLGGKMFPEYATLSCALCSTPSLFRDWSNVFGHKMSAMRVFERQTLLSKPQIEVLKDDDLLSVSRNILTLDMNSATVEDVSVIRSKVFISTHKPGCYQGVVLWFDVTFPEPDEDDDGACAEIVQLDTSPYSEPTHWKQTIILWPEDREVEEGDILGFELFLGRSSPVSRSYIMQLTELDPATDEHPVPCECGSAKCDIVRAFLEQNEFADPDAEMPSERD
ncbi:protein arginine N-methyltransferase 6 [Neocloeon triangulifer]|uniref:protein arginine N-methyltransferase 6 n=1 Tax=Neocloeon triangulifer TaxID=2078957 RepID=UPI00286EDCCD|nr:protein arginine N-methyltransferase 6 [Neocloeon triangulifer]